MHLHDLISYMCMYITLSCESLRQCRACVIDSLGLGCTTSHPDLVSFAIRIFHIQIYLHKLEVHCNTILCFRSAINRISPQVSTVSG